MLIFVCKTNDHIYEQMEVHTREVDRRHLVADLPEFELSDRVSAKFRRSSVDHPPLQPWPCGKSVVKQGQISCKCMRD
jgi:hypothetical protein